jgi:hypothetical protein
MNEKLAALVQLLRLGGAAPPTAPERPQLNTSAPNAAATLRAGKGYRNYVIETQSMGETPLPFEAWVQQGGM